MTETSHATAAVIEAEVREGTYGAKVAAAFASEESVMGVDNQAILATDLGVIPNRRSAFTGINFPTRIFEYLAMGRLVVTPQTPGISDYFGPEDLPMFEQNNVEDMAERILWVRNTPDQAKAMLERGRDSLQLA